VYCVEEVVGVVPLVV